MTFWTKFLIGATIILGIAALFAAHGCSNIPEQGYMDTITLTEVTIKNCTPYWIGFVRFTDLQHSDYETFDSSFYTPPNTTRIFLLQPGLYGITMFDKQRDLVMNYVEYMVYKVPVTWNFNCKE